MTELIIIQVVLGDRTYRLKVKKTDEEIVRKTVKLVNDKVSEFKLNFAGKDMQDYISMALLWFATEQNKSGSFMIEQKETHQKLNSLEHLLDKLLKEE
ncbi:cell division protein ZapA [Arachidicoccus soli]|uniref:Cell division protein ZapA n=1 Tax=Arachidicoccus soli TaxID=2341117 RepID=A0A386HT72_9BACT|nr:cell division protein ZapA [Arachidicoccus soli]AYD49178.1 cell division protein ZapA [Arachidicoccus soli]